MYQGLANVGNTCSINTLVQCLGHCPIFLDYILEQSISVHKRNQQTFCMYDELKELLRQMWKENNSLVPQRFLKALYESLGELYIPGEQFDFTEIWMQLLNILIEETHSLEHKAIHQTIKTYRDPTLPYLQGLSHKSWSTFFQRTNSPLNDIFFGTQIQQIQCTSCNKTYHNVEPLSFLYIDVEEGMEKGMDKLLSSETIEGWKCDECKHPQGNRVVRFWKLPRIWVLILKRFNQNKKLSQPIHILPEFHVGRDVEFSSMSDTDNTSELIHYDLKAIANHYGSLHGGHYNAVCKNKEDWCLYDDLSIQRISSIEPILQNNKNAYALFYERRN